MFFSAFLLFGIFSPIYQVITLGDVNFSPVYVGIICLAIFIGLFIPSKVKEPKQSMEYNYEFKKDKMIITTNTHNTL